MIGIVRYCCLPCCVLVSVASGLPPLSILRLMFPDMLDGDLAALTSAEVEAKKKSQIEENSALLGDVLVTTTTTTVRNGVEGDILTIDFRPLKNQPTMKLKLLAVTIVQLMVQLMHLVQMRIKAQS